MKKTFLKKFLIYTGRRVGLVLLSFVWMSTVYAFSLDDARKDYLNEDYEEAIHKAKTLNQNDATLYFLGLNYMKIGNYPQAREYFLKLTEKFSRSKLYEQGLMKIADSYLLEEDFSKAKALYKEIEKKYPTTDYKSLLYLRLAQIAGKEGRWDEKKKYIALLKEKYPTSNEFALTDIDASRDNFFTVQVGAFSSRKNAFELRNELSGKYDTYVIEDKNENYVLYKVRIGKFKERKEAEHIRGRLIKQGYPARIFP